jgi:hypothetical protein
LSPREGKTLFFLNYKNNGNRHQLKSLKLYGAQRVAQAAASRLGSFASALIAVLTLQLSQPELMLNIFFANFGIY